MESSDKQETQQNCHMVNLVSNITLQIHHERCLLRISCRVSYREGGALGFPTPAFDNYHAIVVKRGLMGVRSVQVTLHMAVRFVKITLHMTVR